MDEAQFRTDLARFVASPGWSQVRLSQETGVSQGSISKFLSEKTTLGGGAIFKIWARLYPANPQPGQQAEG